MAPLVSLCRATGRPAAALTSSRRRSSIRRTVATHATTDDSPNAALLTLSAGALLAQSAVVDSAAAAQLSHAPEQGVMAASQVHASQSNKFSSTTAPAVHMDDSNITRTNSGPDANMDDPDAYFDQVDRMEGRTAPSPAVRFVHIHGGYVEAAVPAPVLGELADQNADVRDVAKNYRDPAGAIQQDKFADKVKSGPSLGSSDLGDSIKSGLKDAQKKATKAVGALPTPAVGDLADLNADVRGASKDYRDPAGAVQQDKFADKVKSGPSLGSSDLGDSIKSGLKDAQKKATKAVSALPTPAVGDLADLNADVRNDATDYRDPAIAVPQDKVSGAVSGSSSGISTPDLSGAANAAKSKLNKAAKAVSALPTPAVGDLADLNADVRGASKDYRDPAGAVQQDKFADKVKSGPGSRDLGDAAKSGLKKAQKKGSRMFSALPTSAVGDLADLNADVRNDATDYRDPAIAVPQDKVSGAVSGSSSGISTPDLSGAADAAKSKLDKAAKAVSALPTPAVGDLADLNADVRGASKDYRDPAGAVQQDKFADKVKSGPSLGSSDLGDSIKSGLKDAQKKATKAVSALPTPAVGDLADLNADVRGASKDYRDPAGAVQQDKFADKVKSGPSLGSSDLGDSIKSGLKDAQKKATKAVSALPTPAVGDLADLNADVRGASKDYRDPAGAVQQDKFADKVKSGPSLGSSDLGDSIKSGLKDAQKKATKAVGALPTPAVGDLADLNADVRGASKDYRDPAGAVQQDKFADKVKSGPSLGSSDLGDSIKSGLKDAQKKATKAVSALPTPAVGDLADLNADVRGASKDYRDPAGAVQQDKFADKVKSGPSLGSSDLGDSIKSGLKDAQKKATKAVGALPTPAVGDLADLNADVRGASKDYRDPAGAVQQDKFADKVKSGPSLGSSDLGDSIKSGLKDAQKKATKAVSALPTPAVGDLADLNADVRGASKDYRDPAGAVQQDKFADKVKSGPSLGSSDLGDSIKSGLKDAQKKATKAVSALPTPAVGDLADLNADVRNDATDYRDPAIAVPQDKVSGAVSGSSSGVTSGISTPDLSGAADAAKSKLDKAAKAVSALPTPAVGDLADLNADVRGASKDYRDPAGAVQQDKFADKVKSGPSLGSSDLGDSIKSSLKDAQKKATKAVSALPTPAVGDLADLNADVRGDAADYRDPAGAIQQDTAAGAVKSQLPDLSAQKATIPSAKKVGKKVLSNVRQTKRDIGVKAGYGASGSRVRDSTGKLITADDVRGNNPAIGNARLSQPLVRDSLGVKRVGSQNQTGAAGGADRKGVIEPLREVVDSVAN